MPDTTGDDEGDGGHPSSASETIAALWREREAQHEALRPTAPPPPPPRPPRRAPAPPGTPESPGKPGFGVGTMAAVVVGALVLAGGVGYVVAGRGGAPSRSAYIAKADAVCRPADALIAIARPSSYPELAAAAGLFATAAEGELGQLRQVSRPGGGAGAEALTVVNDLAATTDAAKGLRQAATDKDDVATVAAAKKLNGAATDTAGAAGAYGMTACGSGLQTPVQTLTQGTQTVVKAGYLAKADAVCRAGSDELNTFGEPNFDDYRALLDFLNLALDVQVRIGDELHALPVPPGDEATVTEMLDAFDKVTAKARTLTNAVSNGDESGFIVASREITTLGTTADAKLDGYGLGICGSNFGNI